MRQPLLTKSRKLRRRGSRPKCCFCQAMLTYITAKDFERALFRQAYGCMWLADGDIVLVNRLLMEAAANRAARALRKRGWSRTTVINPRTNDPERYAKHVKQKNFPAGGEELRRADSGMAPPKAKATSSTKRAALNPEPSSSTSCI